METLTVNKKTLITITALANQLNTSQKEIVQQAVNEYVEKIKRKNRLISYAGILEEEEAEALLNSIQNNRLNKSLGNQ